MNHPGKDLLGEIAWMGELGFDFIDLTLEPPRACAQHVDVYAIRQALQDHGLGVVGHTAFYLPICSPFELIRKAAVIELKSCVEVFAALGATWMNLHPGHEAPFYDRSFVIEQNLRTIAEVSEFAREYGVGLMVENLPEGFNDVRHLSDLLDPVPDLGLHLDIGHANLRTVRNTTDELLAKYAPRVRHVHLHDNKGGTADLHLPLGAGSIDIPHHIRSLQRYGYDGTITLEVFSPDRHFIKYSQERLRAIWNECGASRKQEMVTHA